MTTLEKLEINQKALYSTDYFSGDYNQMLYIKKSIQDNCNDTRYFIIASSNINGNQVQQGYIYFYLDPKTKTSSFIGTYVEPEFRNLNIASLLIANWIDLCLNNDYQYLITNKKQRKPFLLYLLKLYGFDVRDQNLYDTRLDVISVCRSKDLNNMDKLLLFRDPRHEKVFTGMHTFKHDNYRIIHNLDESIYLDQVILPLQSAKRNQVYYEMLNTDLTKTKTKTILHQHRK